MLERKLCVNLVLNADEKFLRKIVDISNFIEKIRKIYEGMKRKLGLIIKKPEGVDFTVFNLVHDITVFHVRFREGGGMDLLSFILVGWLQFSIGFMEY